MSYITISKANFFYNLRFISDKLGSPDKLAVVLKDNAYGHDLLLMAKLSSEFGIKKAVVKNELEAQMIEELFDTIIVLNPNFETTSFSLVLNSKEQLKKIKPSQKIHIKVDTGMHRNGILIDELENVFETIMKSRAKIEGVLTHFRSADELSSELFWQEKQWQEVKNRVKNISKKQNLPLPLFHSANSATILRKTSYSDNFARCGIAIYGYHEMPKSYGEFDLKPVLKLYGEKISSRVLKKGSRVGYGGVGLLEKDSIVSTYDVGYSDGFLRNLYPNLLGKVSMDSLSLIGDNNEVCLIDDAKELAKLNNTISYDVLVKLHPSIPRKIF